MNRRIMLTKRKFQGIIEKNKEKAFPRSIHVIE